MTDFTITVQETVYDLTVTGDTTTIVKQVIGGPHGHAVSDLWQSGATTGQVPTWSGTAWAPATPSGGGGGGVTDGDKGDIVVSSSGAVWSIDYTAVNAVIAPTWANVTGKPTISGTNTGDQTSIVGITGTLAEFNAALTGDNFATGGGTATGTNTGDETAAGILAKLITVDGAGSGLDADLLDGNSAAAFATAAQGTLAASASQPGHTHAAADVSAPGSTTQIVYNNAGALAGSSNVEIENNQLRLEAIASPVAPASGGVSLFGLADAGRTAPAFLSESGQMDRMQSSIRGKRISRANAPVNSSSLNWEGFLGFTNYGTGTAAALSSGTMFTQMKRVLFASSAAAGSLGGTRVSTALCFTGSGSQIGGFDFNVRFAIADSATVSGAQMLVGLTGTGASPAATEPSLHTNCVFIGHGAADTNLKIYYGGSSPQTPIDLGANFPTNTLSTDIYDVTFYSPANATGTVHYRVVRVNTGHIASGTLTGSSAVLPVSTYGLTFNSWRGNNATALATRLAIMHIDLITDY